MSYYDSRKYPFFVENFLSTEICDRIVQYVDSNKQLFDIDIHHQNDYWSSRVIQFNSVPDNAIRQLLIDNNKSVADVLRIYSGGTPVYPDSIQIVRWIKGYELFPHADRENPNGELHPFPWRDFSTLVYLNDDYLGGEIHFPTKNINVRPIKGMLVIFPGTLEFLHGVREVTQGVRYTLPSFFTFDSTKQVFL